MVPPIPVRPETGTPRTGTWVARPRLLPPDHAHPVRLSGWPAYPAVIAFWEEMFVTFVDRQISCVDCGVEFVHSAADQEFYSQRGFSSEPKRCTTCRATRRAARESGQDVSDIGGPRGYERGTDRPAREYFAVVCSSCGNQAQVPFRPRMDRPVYCSDCFRTIKPD